MRRELWQRRRLAQRGGVSGRWRRVKEAIRADKAAAAADTKWQCWLTKLGQEVAFRSQCRSLTGTAGDNCCSLLGWNSSRRRWTKKKKKVPGQDASCYRAAVIFTRPGWMETWQTGRRRVWQASDKIQTAKWSDFLACVGAGQHTESVGLLNMNHSDCVSAGLR